MKDLCLSGPRGPSSISCISNARKLSNVCPWSGITAKVQQVGNCLPCFQKIASVYIYSWIHNNEYVCDIHNFFRQLSVFKDNYYLETFNRNISLIQICQVIAISMIWSWRGINNCEIIDITIFCYQNKLKFNSSQRMMFYSGCLLTQGLLCNITIIYNNIQ